MARRAATCDAARMTTPADFEAAQKRVKALRSTPNPGELLELYALFKQGTQGDVSGSRPGMLDIKGRAKFDAWEKKKGLSAEAAQSAYVKLVAELETRYGAK
jgi:diazepam-binding inhibitor (GABA receptor modulating acyl-CoA-binding protein)